MATEDRKMNEFTVVQDAAYIYAEAADGSQVKLRKSDILNMLSAQVSVNIPSKSMKSIALVARIYSVIDSNLGSSALVDISWDKSYMKIIHQTANNNYSINGSTAYSFQKDENGNYINVTNNSNLDVTITFSI